MLDAARLHQEAHHAVAIGALKALFDLVVLDDELHVVVQVVLGLDVRGSGRVPHNVLVLGHVADREPFHVLRLEGAALAGLGDARRGEVVHDPVVVVLLVDRVLERLHVPLRQGLLAQHVAGRVVAHQELVRRVVDAVARQELPEVLR